MPVLHHSLTGVLEQNSPGMTRRCVTGRRGGAAKGTIAGPDVAKPGSRTRMILPFSVFVLAGVAAAEPPTAGPVLTLSQAVERALVNQPTLHEAQANVEAAQGRIEQARAPGLPQVIASAAYQRTTGNFTPRPGATTTLQTPPSWSFNSYNFFNVGVTASQLIWDFGQTSGRRRAAEASRESARATEQESRLQVVLAVERAYFTALAQQELVRVARDTLANQERHLTQVRGLVEAGIRPDIDLASVRTDVANARVAVINAENSVALARASLDQQMGGPAGNYVLAAADSPPVPGEKGPLEPLLDTAMAARPALASVARARQAQQATVAALRGGYFPAVGAAAGATEAGTGLDRLVPNWVVGVTLTWPLLQGGLTTGQIHEARAVLAGLDAQEQALRLEVRVEVEQAQLSVRAADAAGAAADEAVASAREQLRLAEGRYSAGLGNVIELGDAQIAFTNTEAQAVSARYSLALARAALLAALGKTTQL
jgi:outer membrane protein